MYSITRESALAHIQAGPDNYMDGANSCVYTQAMTSFPPPEGAAVHKDWHRLVTPDLRKHLVTKFVKAIFPAPGPVAAQDQRIIELISFARKVEKDMYEQANDREDYYYFLAEKIYKIQKELQKRKKQRLESMRNGAADPQTTNSSGVKTCSTQTPNHDTKVPECPICFQAVSLSDAVILTPCRHFVCSTCASQDKARAMNQRKNKPWPCPFCRQPVVEEMPILVP